ncbi:MAG: aminomethyl-transferring glycine dehydrogenase subunit GcvPA [Elusimicrobiales bacterium]|jgi:glycine dehydrogenase subunit 1|nr:aminomethyl-transferring glycine dehydrogenase subunit GcvPA [Elusimicrobiales bacterium]
MYISNTKKQKDEMIKEIGAKSFDDLIKQVPQKFLNSKFDLPAGLSELEAYRRMKDLSEKNKTLLSFVGGGVYERYTPAVVKHITERTEFLTAYTPYQAEASQGLLESIYEYQSLMSNLYDMDCSNASLYDGSTSLAEAVKACVRISGKTKILYSSLVNPKYIDVVKTYFANSKEYEFISVENKNGVTDLNKLSELLDDKTACAVVSNPNYIGSIEDIEEFNRLAKTKGVLTVCVADPLSLGILKTPGEAGFDFAVGEGQSLGLPLSYGGPYVGIFTCKKEYLRQMPGRICGMTVDKDGKRGFTLTLQAREQHIRREKAPSNICSNEALSALSTAIYLTLLGKSGLKEVATLNNNMAALAASKFKEKGFKLKFNSPFFSEFAIDFNTDVKKLREDIVKNDGIDIGITVDELGPEFKNTVVMAFTETKTESDISRLVETVASRMYSKVK